MSGTAEVMQEYLVKLGYKTDLISLRKFEDSLGNTGKRILKLGGAVAGVVASVEAASAAFAYSMRKTYFSAELADTSVKSLNAMTYAGKQFGISGDSMAGSIKSMAQAMRLNPGLQGLVESFGIKVQGRDTSDVMLDFVKAIKDMPEFVGQQYASLFGLDPDTYHQMINHYDELIDKRKQLMNQYKDSGIDPDAAKQTILEYTGAMDELKSKLDMLTLSLMTKFMPQFKQLTQMLNTGIDYWIRWAQGAEKVSDIVNTLTAKGAWDFITHGGGKSDAEKKVDELYGGSPSSKTDIMSDLERKNNLPAGVLSKVYKKESGEGKYNLSPKGAEGPFQLMPSTSKALGVKNPYDFNEASGAAAGMLGKLQGKYKGDMGLALAAYNWGEGNVDSWLRTGKGTKGQGMPDETKDYVATITGSKLGAMGAGGDISQTNHININVTGQDSEQIAQAVGRQQSRVLGNATRQLMGNPG